MSDESHSTISALGEWVRDDRARIPFAMIGVLILATSATLVVSMEMSDDPSPDIDEELAMDRSEAAAMTALQAAAQDGVTDAADAPVTAANTSNAVGAALIQANDGDVFENYVRLRIYQQAYEQFDGVTHEFDQEHTTYVDLPTIESTTGDTGEVVEQLERVNLEHGVGSDDLEAGTLRVGIEDVEVRLEADGEPVVTEHKDIETTIGTTLFELHEQTDHYEDQLNKGFFEGEGFYDGFGQYMAARLYLVALVKSGAKYAVGPGDPDNPLFFDEILPNNQTEVLANHAVYGIQRDVFDTTDPYSSRAMRSQAGCLLVETAGEMLGDDFEYEEEVCKGIEAIYGDIEGEKPEAPTVSELLQYGLEQIDAMEEDFEVEIDYPAAMAVRDVQGVLGYENPDDLDLDDILLLEETVSEISGEEIDWFDDLDQALGDFRTELDDLFDDIYTVNTQAEITDSSIDAAEVIAPDYDFSPPPSTDPADWIERGDPRTDDIETTVSEVSVTEEYNEQHPNTPEPFFTVDIAFDQEVTLNQTFEYVGCISVDNPECPDEPPDDEYGIAKASVTVDPVVFEIEGEYAPDASVRDDGGRTLEHAYTDGGSVGFDWANYDGTPEYALNRTFDPHTEMNICDDETDLEVDFEESDLPTLFDAIADNDWIGVADTLLSIDVDSIDQAEQTLLECFNWDNMPDHLENVLEPEDFLDHRVDEDGMASPAEMESALEEMLINASEPVTDLDDVTSLVGYQPSHELMAIPRIEGYGWLGEEPTDEWVEIKAWLDEELEEMVSGEGGPTGGSYPHDSLLGDGDPSVEPASAPRYEFLDSDNDPILQLVDNLAAVEDDIRYQDAEDDRYRNVMDMARTEMYHLFIAKTEDWIYDINELYNAALETVENEIDESLGEIGEILDKVLDFFQEVLDPDPEFHAGEIDDTPLYDDVTFEIHGSPTYLSMDVLDRDVVNTVRPGDEGRFAGREDPRDPRPPVGTNYSSFYSQYTNHLPYPGLPILPEPLPWIISLSTWNVEVGGEYARFEVTATTGDPGTPDTTSYVREQRPIEMDIGGADVHVGDVEAIDFESSTWVVMIMPGGQFGVGDGSGLDLLTGPNSECSITAPYLGPDFEDSERADEIDFDDLYPDGEDPVDDPTCW